MFLCGEVQTGEPSFRPPPSFVLTPLRMPHASRASHQI